LISYCCNELFIGSSADILIDSTFRMSSEASKAALKEVAGVEGVIEGAGKLIRLN